MGDGLEKSAGSKLKTILERLTSSPLKGFLLGVAVTAVIQSSSATTVMVVGFVNSGIMNLRQAIGIIMGANVGTTVTSWILSLSGIQGDSFFVQMLKPSSFSPVLAVIGIVLYMFVKSSKKKDIGSILLGFAVLMFGMETMSGAVEPLKDVPAFTNILLLFSNPVLGVLAGAALTAIIQSSSASVGILQALSATGQITFGSAIPIILGQNIGTCATAMLSSVGTNKNARRTAIVHLYFNTIGTIVFLIAFYALKAVFDFQFVNGSINQVGIAIVHTTFNLVCTAVMLPFAGVLERLACATIKDEPTEADEFQLLDERLMVTPPVAIEQCRKLTIRMAEKSEHAMDLALSLIQNFDPEVYNTVRETEARIDVYEDRLAPIWSAFLRAACPRRTAARFPACCTPLGILNASATTPWKSRKLPRKCTRRKSIFRPMRRARSTSFQPQCAACCIFPSRASQQAMSSLRFRSNRLSKSWIICAAR